MPSYTMIHVRMQRELTSTPWGFRMQGGREFACPLQIQKVTSNSLAERVGIRTDDYIVRIGSLSTEYLTHQQAQEHIKSFSNIIEMVLQRGAPPTSTDYNNVIQAPPVPVPKPQVMIPISGSQALVNQSFNTPIGLYSAENINETITQTLKNVTIDSEVKKVEPTKNVDEFEAAASKIGANNKSVETPAPQSHPVPFTPAVPKSKVPPTSNNGAKTGPNLSKRSVKGSALLDRNENANPLAICFSCGVRIRGPFISAISRCYCVDHFTCSNCSIDLMDCGFVEDGGKLYCEKDFEDLLAPECAKCAEKILKECVLALEKNWHPECFLCSKCKKSIGNGSFHIEEGLPYCIEDYRRMFQIKCTGCEFPIEAGDKYLEAMGGTYHAECFTCSTCQVSLDGQGFVVKNNRPYCRQHGTRQVLSLFR